MPSVTTPHDYFRQERDESYADWRLAFARELIQNSQDAGATQMAVEFVEMGTHGRVVFSDNGCGMSLDDLHNGFFELGTSNKRGDGRQTGGYGRARELNCFGQRAYAIRTQDLRVDGVGGHYEVTTGLDRVAGTTFTIDLDDPDCDLVRDGFERLLRLCALTASLSIDGRTVRPRPLPDRARRILTDAEERPWARVYADKGRPALKARTPFGEATVMLVRVNGLLMFAPSVDGLPFEVAVELIPSRSREVMTHNRDSLKSRFRWQLEAFVSDLTQNRSRALETRTRRLDTHVSGGGFMATNAYEPPSPATEAVAGAAERETADGDVEPSVPSEGGGVRVPLVAANAAAQAAATRHTADRPDAPAAADGRGRTLTADRAALPFDVFMLAREADTRVRQLARVWNPAGWDDTTGRNRRKLLVAWQAAVGFALDELVRIRPDLQQVLWTVGWVFDADVDAVHRLMGDGHVLALNPVDELSRTRFTLNDRADRRRLLALAKHEVCHVVAVDRHDEAMVNLYTDLDAALDPVAADRTIVAAFKAA